MLQDKILTCRDCGKQFVFTTGEQEFYAQRGFTHDPSRCPECRAARRAQRGDAGTYGDAASYAGTTARAPRQMFTAVCSACGGEARVPFQPRSDKPVYCSNCFQTLRPSGGVRSGGGGSYNRY